MSATSRRGELVAVLSRRGRFLVAEPLFPQPEVPIAQGRRGAAGGIVVGNAGSRAGRDGAREGDVVLLGMSRNGAKVLRRIGRPDVARDVIEALLLDRGERRAFSAGVEREAAEAGPRVMRKRGERRDLTSLATFTIDPISARDFDDAISAERMEGGRVRVWVHIADVAAHVPPGSAIDREARRRATSVYVPGTVEPMLPHALSSDACSLVPGQVRATVTVEMELEGAKVLKSSFYRSLIRSDERLDYERVDRIFAGSERAGEPWAAPLEAARGAAKELARAREQSGAVELDSPEPEFEFDEEGYVMAVHGRVQTESHGLIEQLMIAANEAVAELLSERRVPCLYRVHERPEPSRVERLVDQLASLEVPTPPVPERMSSSQAADLVGEISVKVAEHLRGGDGRGRLALGLLILRSLKQAYYSPVNLGHAGLHSSAYCHFTSPIRRYPDIVCHRALLSAVGGGEQAHRAGELAGLGEWTSDRERQAMLLERDGDDIAACFALEMALNRAGAEVALEGEVTGLIGAGAFVAFTSPLQAEHEQGELPPFEGMLPVRLMRAPSSTAAKRGREGRGGRGGPRHGQPEERREWWELNEEGTILRGERSGATLRLGDEVKVRVARIEAIRGRVDLEPAG